MGCLFVIWWFLCNLIGLVLELLGLVCTVGCVLVAFRVGVYFISSLRVGELRCVCSDLTLICVLGLVLL